jgi:hypothetical protein
MAGIGKDRRNLGTKPAGDAGDQGALVGEAEATHVARHRLVLPSIE